MDGNIPVQLGIGGIFSILVIREVLTFLTSRKKNGKLNGDVVKELMGAADAALRAHEDILARYKLMQDSLEKHTTVLVEVREGIHTIHVDMMLLGKDIVRGFSLLEDDVRRSISRPKMEAP